MNYKNLKNLEETNKTTLLLIFNGILTNIKNISFRKSASLIKDFPSICEIRYKSYEYIEKKKFQILTCILLYQLEEKYIIPSLQKVLKENLQEIILLLYYKIRIPICIQIK